MNLLGENMGKKIYIQPRFILELNTLLVKGKPKKDGAPFYESLS